MPTANELLGQRATLLNQGRAILDRAEAEKRELLAEERQAYDKIWADSCALKDRADQILADFDRKKQLDAAINDLSTSQGRRAAPILPGSGPAYLGHDGANGLAPHTFKLHSRRYTRSGRPAKADYRTVSFPHGSAAWARHQPEYRKALADYMFSGRPAAALQTDLSTAGGYMVLPEQFVSELLMDVDNLRWIRKVARIFTTNAQTLGAVKRTSRMASFQWGSELSTPGPDPNTSGGNYQSTYYASGTTQGLQFGKRTLTPHYMTGEILVSRDLLRSALLPVEEIVRGEIARDSGELEEVAFQSGSGAQQPLGLFTASNDGIDTSRDVNNYNTTTSIQADNLRTVKYTLKEQYRQHPSLRWLFSRIAIGNISKLKDGVGQYLWRDGISEGDPDRILGIPVIESEFTPSTFTTGQYVGLLGAFYYYWICDSLEMDLMTLVEKYAETNQIAYVARRKTDGMPQIAEAFVRVKLG
jgi:HK97 family phage major capsid protein